MGHLIIILICLFSGYIGYMLGRKHKPKKSMDQLTIEELFTELKDSIIKEDYEKAALIRDELRKLTN